MRLSTSPTAPLGIIGAMDIEVELLKEAMGSLSTERHGDIEFASGTLEGKPCIVVQCGVGMVNAAACTQALVDRFEASGVINTGVAGALQPSVRREELVIAADAVNWVMDVQNLGYAPGQTPGMTSPFIPTSEPLSAVAAQAAQTASIPAHRGRIASGDRFVRDASEKVRIAETFNALCCEMEGAAIAQVCQSNGVACAILRVISDNADGEDALDYPAFEARAARRCADITRRMVSLLQDPCP